MVKLTSIPAFGFETANCNAEDCYYELYKKGYEEKLARFDISERVVHKDAEKILRDTAQTAWKVSNFAKVIGYIPLVGSLIGFSRISKAGRASNEELPNKYSHIARGCVELVSLGFLLIIPDLILTAYRRDQANHYPSHMKV